MSSDNEKKQIMADVGLKAQCLPFFLAFFYFFSFFWLKSVKTVDIVGNLGGIPSQGSDIVAIASVIASADIVATAPVILFRIFV